jgi:pyruvate,orthophosphate dikinase
MFGKTCSGVDGELFEHELDKAKRTRGSGPTPSWTRGPRAAGAALPGGRAEQTGAPFPQEPARAAGPGRAGRVLQLEHRPGRALPPPGADLGRPRHGGQRLLDGLRNLGEDSGTGVAFTRDPASGLQGLYGDYLQDAQGEDVVAGIRNTLGLADLEAIDATSYAELLQAMAQLEKHYRDLCDIEFTIERGKLWMLQTRVGKRTAAAAFRIATQLVDEGLIGMDEALERVTGAQLAQLMFPRSAPPRTPSCCSRRWAPARAPPSARWSSTAPRPSAAARGSRCCWSGGRPTPTTWPG